MMMTNLAAETVVIALTVLIHTSGLMGVTGLVAHFRMHGRRSRILAMITVVFGLFAVLTIEVWLWAVCYLIVGAFPDFVTGLYFSTVTFSTLQWLSSDWLVNSLSGRRINTGPPISLRRTFLT
jgi:hypothetical protein